MRDFTSFRTAAIRYWEWRRIVYNLALVPPAMLGYGMTTGVMHLGDVPDGHSPMFVVSIVLGAIGANICYTFCYVPEFLFGSDDSASRWQRGGRSFCFVVGMLLGVLLANVCGWNVAQGEWNYHVSHIR